MDFQLPASDRIHLRELARKQAEYAALPVMAQRRQWWLDLNDGKRGTPPPFVIETWTFDRDFMPRDICRCESELGRGIEGQLLRRIREHELINDDKIVPDTFEMWWSLSIDEIGVKIPRNSVKDAQGYETGYEFIHPIKDLKQDFHLLRPAVCSVDRETTRQRQAFLEELFQGLLRVRLISGTMGCTSLTQRVIQLMGMEAFFTAMYDQPDEVHRLMAYLRDNCLRVMRWAEAEGLLRLNNEAADSSATDCNITTRLPASGYQPPAARLCDMWGGAESQETVGVAPAMFHEFCYPYYRDVCEPVGLLYWGCCEPAHPFWDDLKRMPHLKKVSISRWCDERFMGEALRGTDIQYSRKPDPMILSTSGNLDEAAWAAHIRATLEATRGVALEFVVRDVYTFHGDLSRPRRAVEIAHREIEKHWRA